MKLPYRIVDVFAVEPLAGNPLAVFHAAAGVSDELMQRLANETNLSETTFVTGGSAEDGYDVRIFTPAQELPFAGHPTLGTAAVLAGEGDGAVLRLAVGDVPVERDDEGTWWLRSPPVALEETVNAADALAISGLEASDLDEEFAPRRACVGPRFTLLPLASMDALRRCRLDVDAYRERFGSDAMAEVYAFVRGGERPEDVLTSRLLFDAGGVREDPATGSAAACLAAYLSEHDYFGGEELAIAVSQGALIGRPSTLHLRVGSDETGRRIEVGGRVQDVARGEFDIATGGDRISR